MNHRQERLIDDPLVLASSAEQLETMARVGLAEAAHRSIVTAGPAAARAGVAIYPELHSAYVKGDPALLDRLAQSLLDNAIRYNVVDGGWVRVMVYRDGSSTRCRSRTPDPSSPRARWTRCPSPFRRSGRRSPGRRDAAGRSVAVARGGDAPEHDHLFLALWGVALLLDHVAPLGISIQHVL